jgi:threonine/homoserine/homoserine lactone efflux protein
MTSQFAIAGMISAAALSPGPNNLIVLQAAMRSGMLGALPAIGGVVLGGLALLGVLIAGADEVFARWPHLPAALSFIGAAYLAWLGLRMMASKASSSAPASAPEPPAHALPAGIVGMFAFQFLNPKGWIMAMTAVAAAQGSAASNAHWQLVLLFVLVPIACLLAWSTLGVLFGAVLRHPAMRHRFDRAMGVLLLASATLLLASN